jgi:hypothetical protein
MPPLTQPPPTPKAIVTDADWLRQQANATPDMGAASRFLRIADQLASPNPKASEIVRDFRKMKAPNGEYLFDFGATGWKLNERALAHSSEDSEIMREALEHIARVAKSDMPMGSRVGMMQHYADEALPSRGEREGG